MSKVWKSCFVRTDRICWYFYFVDKRPYV